jgi:hypothetical protein
VGAIVSGDRNFDEGEIARHGRHIPEILDPEHVDQLVEVRRNTLGADLIAVDDDRHARDPWDVSPADRQRLDIEGTAPEQRRHAIEYARLVFDEGY